MAKYLNPSELVWMRRPEFYLMKEDAVTLETQPHSSFHFPSGDVIGLSLEPMESFVLTVRADYHFRGNEDECGVILKRDHTHWAKAGVECRGKSLDLACTLYGGGYGDRSTRELGSGICRLYFRILYWNGNARFQYSFNGGKFSDMRWMHLAGSREPVTAGIYACSPGDSIFDCTFSEMMLRKI